MAFSTDARFKPLKQPDPELVVKATPDRQPFPLTLTVAGCTGHE
jgi:hypothetical protein